MVVVGSRSGIRTVTKSPAPVDVISGDQLQKQGNTLALRDILAKIIPSFSVATVPSQPDGYGSVARSAGLRGFGGGHTLVLVNGKRRHVGALAVNKYGFVEGYQAADLDLIPINAIARIEVLRDGAAAQYGSDAIAGVINIVLKSADHGGSITTTYGGREHYSGTDRNGETFQLNGNVGTKLGSDGFVNFGYDIKNQDATTRAGQVSGDIYSKVNGQSDPREATFDRNVNKLGLPSVEQLNLSFNAELPLGDATKLYTFTTAGWRDAITGASYRRPNSRSAVTEIYPNGTTPVIALDERDYQSVWGVKGDNFLGWAWDASTSYGKDTQKHSTSSNLNPSLGTASPTSFGLQKYETYQWSNNLDFRRAFDIGFGYKPFNVAWGLDYRKEGWSSKATDPLAYKNGGYIYTTGDNAGSTATVGTFGALVLLPEDEAKIKRSNTAAYLDLSLDVTPKWLVGIAGRFEHYDDSSGNTLNGKINSRYEITPELAVRGTIGTGFIAPSLYQQGFASTGIVSTIKNALTTLPLGGGKGGSDFDPKGKSEGEVMRFCQSLITELYRHLGPDTDIPAGDIGVGGREVGYMAGMMKKLSNNTASVFTGKGISFGGSLVRPEATGYGTVYFAEKMLKTRGESFQGKTVAISGSGNVVQYAAEKAMSLGAKVVTLSDSNGTLYVKDGLTDALLAEVMDIKNRLRGRLSTFATQHGFEFFEGQTPWHIAVDIALPCATQNELDTKDAEKLIQNGLICVAEGANMPSTLGAVEAFIAANILYAPGKASNAGGVATSGLEMSQNAMRLSWTHEEVGARLQHIMKDIHQNCVKYGTKEDGNVNYVDGANIAGFVKVADAMLAQGVL